MRKSKSLKKIGVIATMAVFALTPLVSAVAATSTATTNNTAASNDLSNADIIDSSQKGSVAIYKYDITAAEAAGDYKAGTYKATGESDSSVEDALADYGMEGVQFSYLRVGDVETHSISHGTVTSIELVYEIPSALAKILNLSASDALDMTSSKEAKPCDHTDVYHFTSQQLGDAIAAIFEKDDVAAKNALEDYMYEYGDIDSTTDQNVKTGVVNMDKTDENGYTCAGNLELGLYLFVETEVPENVVETVNPWFVQLPFTNSGGEQWLYDMTCYPKNQTGNPTLDKKVRNAYSNTAEADKNGTVNFGKDYVSGNMSESLVVYNADTNAQNKEDSDGAAYVANRGGYTSDGVTAGADGAGYSADYTYADTTTASEGDVLDYILVSRLPHISSSATFLSEYTFFDTLSAGITYNRDVKIAFYDNAEDAKANNTVNADMLWNLSGGDYANVDIQEPDSGQVTDDGSTRLTVSLTETGLNVINGTGINSTDNEDTLNGLSDYYMVVYYTATVNSDASVVLGDEGNPNDARLIWSRTSDGYYNMLEDRNYVYTYGMELTKTFSDNKGDFSNVQFKLYNGTDAYYVVAEKDADGIYYVTGKTTDEANATSFTPDIKDGSLIVNGMEADTYYLTEAATDDGYNLLKDRIAINITATDREVIASVAGVTGMDADAVAEIVKNYHGGIYDENGNLVTSQLDEITFYSANAPADEDANGRTIGKTDMYVGPIRCASATVDEMDADMAGSHASVLLSVKNTKGFLLPQTGGNGLYFVTILGIIVAAGGCYFFSKKRKNS